MSGSRVPLSRGFTLLELLLAMAISAMIALLGYAGLNSALEAGSRMQADIQRLQQLQRTFTFLEEDLLQFVNRPVTDAYGTLQPALAGGSFSEPRLALTRGGWSNPAALPRSELLRVHYQLDNAQLLRLYTSAIDSSEVSGNLSQTLLLGGVEQLEVEFLPAVRGSLPADMLALGSALGGWEDYWNSQFQAAPQLPVLPLAVRVSIQMQGLGQVQRVYQLPR